jgi:hypothetical protein
VALTTYPHLAPRLKKEYSYTSITPLGFHGLFWDEYYLYILVLGSSQTVTYKQRDTQDTEKIEALAALA